MGVHGIGVGVVFGIGALGAAVHVGARDVVHLDKARLAAGLDGHVGDGKALVHGHGADSAARELHGLVQRTVNADHADDVQDDVLAGDTGSKLAVDLEQQAFGNLEPCFTGCIAHGGVGGANAGGERAERAVGAGMGIGADDQIARAHDALLGQQRVLDAHATDLVVMRDALLTGEIAHLLGLLGAFDVLVRNIMVGNQGDFSGVEDLLHADLLEILDGDRRRDVVGKHQVEIALDQLPRLDFVKPRMCGQDLLSHGHGTCHVRSLDLQTRMPVYRAFCKTG